MKDTGTIGGTLSFPDLLHWAAALFKSPRTFFRSMERTGGYLTPCLYLLAWSVVSTAVSAGVALTRPVPAGFAGGRGLQMMSIAFGPVAVLVVGFLTAAFLFVVWHLMGSKEGYETAFRTWAFLAPVGVVTAVLGIIPFLPLLSFAYALYLVVLASQEVHGISSQRSWVVWGGLGAGFFVFVVVAALAGLAAQSGKLPGYRGGSMSSGYGR